MKVTKRVPRVTCAMIAVLCVILPVLLSACQQPRSTATDSIDQRSYRLGGIGAFAEMVGAGVKRLALSAPMPAG